MVIMVAVKAAVIPAICPVQVGLCKLVRVEGWVSWGLRENNRAGVFNLGDGMTSWGRRVCENTITVVKSAKEVSSK